jgi:ribosomal protein S15P/S13E
MKVRQVKIKKTTVESSPALQKMVESIFDDSRPDLEVCIPKYMKLRKHMLQFSKLLHSFVSRPFMQLFKVERKNILDYVKGFDKKFHEIYEWDNLSLDTIDRETALKFASKYRLIKKNLLMDIANGTFKNLASKSAYIKDLKQLSAPGNDNFLLKHDFAPIYELNSFNVNSFYMNEDVSPADKKYILTVLTTLYKITNDIRKTAVKPDIKPETISMVVSLAMSEVKKHIPDCAEAIDKITESADLLENNFEGYYEDYCITNTPFTIMEKFIKDVSEKGKADKKNKRSSIKIFTQYRKIINFFRKQMNQQQMQGKRIKRDDGVKIDEIFNLLNSQIDECETETKKEKGTEKEKGTNEKWKGE